MADLTSTALNIVRTQNHYYELDFFGLVPNTIHTITFQGRDWGYATKQLGKDFGDNLVSNDNGEIRTGILMELLFPRDQNFELPKRTTLQYQNEQLSSGSKKAVNIIDNYRVFELTSINGSSKAQYIMHFPFLLTAGPVSTLYPIDA